jgi:hypothetical protein
VQDGRIHIELINLPFLNAGGTPAEFRAGIEHTITKGWLWRHESGVYVKFTPARGRAVRLMAANWKRRFNDPIKLSNGGKLVTLKDARYRSDDG